MTDLSEQLELLKGPSPAVLKLLNDLEDDDPLLPRWWKVPINDKPKEFSRSVDPQEFGHPGYRLDSPIADEAGWTASMMLQRPPGMTPLGVGARDAYQHAVSALTSRCIVDWEIPSWTFGSAWDLRYAMRPPPIIRLTDHIVATSCAPSPRFSPTVIMTLRGLRFYIAWGSIRAITGA